MYSNEDRISRSELLIIFSIALIIFCIYQYPAILNRSIINDDVRVQYYPAYRVHDMSLYPNDIITDLFTYETPRAFFYSVALLSYLVDMITLSKIMSLIAFLLVAYYTYRLGRFYLGKPGSAMFLILFLIQIWSFPSISGGLPRSFALVFIAGFLYYQASGRDIKKSAMLITALLIYPPSMFVAWITYGLLKLPDLKELISKRRFTRDLKLLLLLTAVLFAIGTVLYSDTHANRFGNLADYHEVSTNPVFGENGRVDVFPVRSYPYMIYSFAGNLILATLVLLVPFLFFNRKKAFRLPKEFWALLVSGIILHYFGGYTGLMLNNYSRFSRYTFPLFLVFFFSYNIELILPKIRKRFRMAAFILVLVLTGAMVAAGTTRDLIDCSKTDVYSFLSTTPKNTLVAGYPLQTSCIPLYSKRMVFTSHEGISPEYSGYYSVLRNRTFELFDAYFSDNITAVEDFCRKHDIDYLLVDRVYLEHLDYSEALSYEPFRSYIENITQNRTYFALLHVPDEKKIINNDQYYLIRCGDI